MLKVSVWRYQVRILVELPARLVYFCCITQSRKAEIVKVNLKLSLCFFLTEHHAMKAYWGVEVLLHTFF
jgi:hypothetical protein